MPSLQERSHWPGPSGDAMKRRLRRDRGLTDDDYRGQYAMSVSTLLLALAASVLANAIADALGAERWGRMLAGTTAAFVVLWYTP